MYDLGKSSRQRLFDIAQERRVGIEVGESPCLELKSFATEVIVDEFQYSALGGVGRVYVRKRSQDRLLI
jgi:hypothetical protein